MTMRAEIKGLVSAAVPGLSLVQVGLRILCAIAAAVLVVVVVWWLFFSGREAAQIHDKVEAQSQGRVNKAEGEAARRAVQTIDRAAGRETIIRERTNTNYVEITKQPGAGDPVSDHLWDAFVHSVCLRESARRDPQCKRLQEAPAGIVEGGSTERAAPAE